MNVSNGRAKREWTKYVCPLLQLAQVWLDAATKLDGLFLTQTKAAPDEQSKTARSAD
jgi:hypothetical protein